MKLFRPSFVKNLTVFAISCASFQVFAENIKFNCKDMNRTNKCILNALVDVQKVNVVCNNSNLPQELQNFSISYAVSERGALYGEMWNRGEGATFWLEPDYQNNFAYGELNIKSGQTDIQMYCEPVR